MVINCMMVLQLDDGFNKYCHDLAAIITERLKLMTVAKITMMNSNDLTNIFTWEGFLLLSIHLLMEGKFR